MSLSRQDLEDLVERLRAAVLKHDELAQEFAGSLAEFLPAGTRAPELRPEPEGALTARRHLEWFLFERPSEVLGGVPVEALMTSTGAGVHAESLLNSLAGVFEVTGVEDGRGLWLRDLFGLGEYPAVEPEATAAVLPGDLAIGRVFPAGDSAFRLSPAVAVIRKPKLLEALKRDVERLRAGRRGTLRIAQLELERMFFVDDAALPEVDPVTAETELRQLLQAAGADPDFLDRLLDELRSSAAAGRSDAVTAALNRLAFDTNVDLEQARAGIVTLWGAWTSSGPPAGDGDAAAPPDAVAEALARFDAGRGAGKDLNALFRSLEEDLGLATGEEPDEEIAPDFPGVVSAVVQEFLWEVGRDRGAEVAQRYEPLQHLGECTAEIGVIENLTTRHVVEFTGRHALDRKLVASADEAKALLDAVGEFCRWTTEQHQLDLWSDFEETFTRLTSSLPRIVELRRRRPPAEIVDGVVYRFERARDGRPLLVDADGDAHEVELDDVYDGMLRNNDIVHARLTSDSKPDTPIIGACYPPELFSLAR